MDAEEDAHILQRDIRVVADGDVHDVVAVPEEPLTLRLYLHVQIGRLEEQVVEWGVEVLLTKQHIAEQFVVYPLIDAAEEVELTESARVFGDISTKVIVIDENELEYNNEYLTLFGTIHNDGTEYVMQSLVDSGFTYFQYSDEEVEAFILRQSKRYIEELFPNNEDIQSFNLETFNTLIASGVEHSD